MYDLEIMVPAELKNDTIITRFKDFCRWGFVNTENAKIKLCFVASYDNDPADLQALCNSWPANFDAEYLITPHKHVAQRIMHYYNNALKPDVARWYVRIDEDSRTDISHLLANMDKWFDHEREYHVVAECSKEVQDAEYRILTSLGYDWFDEIVGYNLETAPIHEIEISLTSNAAVKRITASKKCQEFLKIREEFSDGQGDHAFGFAARMEKIYQTSVPFLTRHPRAIDFSFHGGRYSHIHDISRDRHGEYIKWLEISGFATEELKNSVANKYCFFNWNNEKIWVRLEESGRISRIPQRCVPEWSHKTEPIGIWGFTETGDLTLFITNEFYHNRTPNVFEKIDSDYFCRNNQNMSLTSMNQDRGKKMKMI